VTQVRIGLLTFLSLIVCSPCEIFIALLSSGESSKPQSHQKVFLMGELAVAKRFLAQPKEEMRQLEDKLQTLETRHERQPRGRMWEQRRASRSYNHYNSHKEDENWRIHQYDERRHQYHPYKIYFLYVKLPSFSGESDPNIYLGWEAKVGQIFNVYEVQDDQKVN